MELFEKFENCSKKLIDEDDAKQFLAEKLNKIDSTKLYNKYFSAKVFVVRNPNRKNKFDQYNVRVLLLDDVLKLMKKRDKLIQQIFTK